MGFFNSISKTLETWNRRGVYLPVISDPKTGQGSLTASMFWAAFTMCLTCGLLFVSTAVAHMTGVFAPGDQTQEAIKNASQYFLELYIATGGFYLGRKFQKDSKGALSVDDKKEDQ